MVWDWWENTCSPPRVYSTIDASPENGTNRNRRFPVLATTMFWSFLGSVFNLGRVVFCVIATFIFKSFTKTKFNHGCFWRDLVVTTLHMSIICTDSDETSLVRPVYIEYQTRISKMQSMKTTCICKMNCNFHKITSSETGVCRDISIAAPKQQV